MMMIIINFKINFKVKIKVKLSLNLNLVWKKRGVIYKVLIGESKEGKICWFYRKAIIIIITTIIIKGK